MPYSTSNSAAHFARVSRQLSADLAYRVSRMKQLPGLANGLTSALQRNQYMQSKVLKPLDTTIKKAEKTGGLLDKILGLGGSAKALQIGSIVTAVIGIGGVAAILAIKIKYDEMTQAAQEKGTDILSRDLSKALTQIQINRSKLREFELSDQRTRDRTYALEKQIAPINKTVNDTLYEVRQGRQILEGKITESKQQSNDALYEVRQGRQILEGKITESKQQANDALYETRQGRQILEGKIAESKQQANDALYETRQGRQILEGQISESRKLGNDALSRINKNATLIDTLTRQYNELSSLKVGQGLGGAVNARLTELRLQIQAAQNIAQSAIDKNHLQDGEIRAAVGLSSSLIRAFDAVPRQGDIAALRNELNQKTEATQNLIDTKINKAEIKHNNDIFSHDALQKKLEKDYSQSIEDNNKALFGGKNPFAYLDKISADTKKLQDDYRDLAALQYKASQGDAKAAAEVDKKIALELDNFWEDIKNRNSNRSIIPVIEKDVSKQVNKKIAPINNQLNEISKDLDKQEREINEINKKIKEGETMDIEANKKLDKMLPLLGNIPLLPGRVSDALRPSIPTLPQINTEVGKAVCKSFNGGCGKSALDGQTADINSAAKANNNDLLNKFNAGANAGLLAGQQEILKRLGNFIPGGLSGKLIDGFKWLQIDRALNILTFAATVHNAAMLSNDILQTLVGALTNVLTLITPKDEKGQPFDVGQAINSTVEGVVKGIVGAENYTNLTNAWAKANRIYQATTNVLNSFMSLTQVVLQASEMIAAYTGKIGNALKKGGVVLENAYGWMNPQPKFNRVTQALEGFQATASTVQMVTQIPLDFVNATTELTTASTEFVKAVKEDGNEKNKATEIPEPDKVKEKETQSKTDSQPSPFDFSDLFDGED
ncbi:hypothetical protein [Trichormus sp. NMC-1]|uniref:hypothetical protein n=1 Tax=Trichormus sp. NMC-1 TaxID=1853259 RepID=UPI0008DC2C3A|nr:hypothetical protein [Trichormus sp. NMC-1]